MSVCELYQQQKKWYSYSVFFYSTNIKSRCIRCIWNAE